MNKIPVLLFSLILAITMLAHDAHAALHAGADQHTRDAGVAVTAVSPHAESILAGTSPMHHKHGLPELTPELCIVDGEVTPPVATGPSPVAIAMATPWHAAFPSLSPLKPSFEEPAYPPAVRRALLQIYLN